MAARRALPFLVLALLIAPLAWAPPFASASASDDDCGSGRDAGDSPTSAVALALPVARCVAALPPHDVTDAFTFHGEAGHILRAELRYPTYAGDVLLCVGAPSDGNGYRACGKGLGSRSLRYAMDETGTWTLFVFRGLWHQDPYYELTVSANVQEESVHILVGHPVLPEVRTVSDVFGPGPLDGIDGQWVELTEPATGRQSALVETEHWYADVDAWFYDGTGGLLPDQPCTTSTTNWRELCIVPVGATHALVTARGYTDFGIQFAYFR